MPTIHLDKCIKCLKCVHDCPSEAIDIELGTINDSCIHCGHCVAICPESTVFPDAGGIQKLQVSTVTPADFQQLSAGIRTCRSYLDREVDDDLLHLLIGNMKHYPSASNARPVEITVVKSREAVQRLNDQTGLKLIRAIRFITLPVLKPVIGIMAPKMNVSRLVNYKKRFITRQIPESSQICHHAPAVMLFHAPEGKYSLAADDSNIWATYTSLYANTLGLGTCFNGFIVKAMERSKALRKEFGIPDNHRVHTALLMGHPKMKYTNQAGRDTPKANFI